MGNPKGAPLLAALQHACGTLPPNMGCWDPWGHKEPQESVTRTLARLLPGHPSHTPQGHPDEAPGSHPPSADGGTSLLANTHHAKVTFIFLKSTGLRMSS